MDALDFLLWFLVLVTLAVIDGVLAALVAVEAIGLR